MSGRAWSRQVPELTRDVRGLVQVPADAGPAIAVETTTAPEAARVNAARAAQVRLAGRRMSKVLVIGCSKVRVPSGGSRRGSGTESARRPADKNDKQIATN